MNFKSAVALFCCNLLKSFERFAIKLILPYVGCIDIFSLVELHFAFFKAESVSYVVGEDDAVVHVKRLAYAILLLGAETLAAYGVATEYPFAAREVAIDALKLAVHAYLLYAVERRQSLRLHLIA